MTSLEILNLKWIYKCSNHTFFFVARFSFYRLPLKKHYPCIINLHTQLRSRFHLAFFIVQPTTIWTPDNYFSNHCVAQKSTIYLPLHYSAAPSLATIMLYENKMMSARYSEFNSTLSTCCCSTLSRPLMSTMETSSPRSISMKYWATFCDGRENWKVLRHKSFVNHNLRLFFDI